MSNKKSKKKSLNTKLEKYVSYGTLLGLIIGSISGILLFIITDNMFWFALAPITLMFLGLCIGSYLGSNKSKTQKRHS